ncbi:MAG: serpin family protein [Anaerolineae bacterium]|nr:serpin family protein [Anaerolineae bacterium]
MLQKIWPQRETLFKFRLSLVGIAWLLLALTACTAQPQSQSATEQPATASPVPATATPEPTATQPAVKREMAPAVTEVALAELSAGNSAFAFDLYQALRSEDGNLFYSPHSISIALAMTYAGARENTAKQMAETLHFTLPPEQLHPAFNALDLSLNRADKFTLNVANALWGQIGYEFRPEFLDTLALNYGAGLQLLDYVDASNREQSRQTINRWVSDQTAGKIADLIKEGVLNENTRLVLTNAIYFKADWALPFLDGTYDAPFMLLNGSRVNVPTMSRRAGTVYVEGGDYQAIELSYKGDRMRMVILLPAMGQFEAFESALTGERVTEILQTLTSSEDAMLYMPKFSYDTAFSLASTLAQMGMRDAFSPDAANFSGMDGSRNLFISDVVHQAFVAVDETGTEAAAATGVIVGIESMPAQIRIDRPFIFLIQDVRTGAILFVGRLVDPR